MAVCSPPDAKETTRTTARPKLATNRVFEHAHGMLALAGGLILKAAAKV
jgi:hypothetical protein